MITTLKQAEKEFKKLRVQDRYDVVIPPIEWVAHPYTQEDHDNWASNKLQIDTWIDKYKSKIKQGKNIIYVIIDTAGTWNFADMQYAVNPDLCFDHTNTGKADDHGHSHMIGTTTFHKKYGLITRLAEMGKVEVSLIKGLSKGGGQWTWLRNTFLQVEAIAKANPNKQVVVNCSFGAVRAFNAEMSAIAERTKKELDVIWIGSIGNSGQSQEELGGFPGIDKSFIGVGAVDRSQRTKSYSSKSEFVDTTSYSGVPGYDHKGNFGLREGTSFSGPNFAALVCLALLSGHTTPATLYSDIENKSKDLGPVGFDKIYGYGLLDFDTWTRTAKPEPPKDDPEEPEEPEEPKPEPPTETITLSDIMFQDEGLQLRWKIGRDGAYQYFDLTNLTFKVTYEKSKNLSDILLNMSSELSGFFSRNRFFQMAPSHDIRHVTYFVGIFLNHHLKRTDLKAEVTEVKGGQFNQVFTQDITKPLTLAGAGDAVQMTYDA
jgi:hypothetical protein